MDDARRPGNRSHLERLIDQWSKEDGAAPTGRLRRLVAISVLTMILDGLELDGEPRLAFKGGASLELRFGATARASRDVDAIVNVTLDDAIADIAERLSNGWEGFTGVLGDATEIVRAGITPAPQRCKVKLAYKGRPFHTLDFELGYAEAGSFDLVELIDNQVDLDKVQLGPAGEVVVLGVHHQIAQKLHACTEIPTEGENARVHDLYDILLLAPLAIADGLDKTKAACLETFDHRAKHAFPPELPDWPSWPLVWDNLGVPDDLRHPYTDARVAMTELIASIASA